MADSALPDPLARLREIDFSPLGAIAGPVVESLAQVLAGAAAERVLDRLLRAHRDWTAPERKAAAEALFGVGLWRRRLAYCARPDSEPGDATEATEHASPACLLACFLRDLAGVAEADALAWSGLGQDPPKLAASKPPPEDLGVRWSYPDWLVDTFRREVSPAELEPLLATLNLPGPICLRANRLKTSRAALREALAAEGIETRPCLHAPLGLIAEGRPNLFGSRAMREGLFEVQDEGSQLLGLLLDARPGEQLLDFCAGAGGKTLLLAAELNGRGTLWAYDPDLARLDRLTVRAGRALTPTAMRTLRVLRAPPPADLQVDRVLVDAPCSELGALRRGPDLRHRLDPVTFAELPSLQRGILDSAARHVREGGRLVYATCTLRREENQTVALGFLEAHPEFRLARPGESWLDETFIREGFFVSLPHRHGTDGFFAAVMERTGPTTPHSR